MRWVLPSSFLLLTLGCTPAKSELSVSGAWARPALAGMNSAVYLEIDNPGPDDELVSAHAEIATLTQLHLSIVADDGTVRMEEQPAVSVPSGGRVRFQPGGLHIMLMDLKEPLEVNDSFPMDLAFRDHDGLSIPVTVRAP